MNIAIVIPSMEIGGAERVTLFLADHYKALGHNVYFFFLSRYGKKFECEYEYCHISYNKTGNDIEQFIHLADAAREMRAKKKELGIDVSISFMEAANCINMLSKTREKVIISTRTTLSVRNELPGIVYNPLLIKLLYNRAYKVVTASEYTKNDLIKNYGLLKNKVISIPNPAIRYAVNGSNEWKYGDNTVLHVGRMDSVKQQDRLIRAFSLVHNEIPNAKLVILGDGRIRSYLTMISEKMGVKDSVFMPGFVEELGFYYFHSKVFIMASKAEGFPNAMVEAMAYGVPVISTDSPGGCAEIIGEVESGNDIRYCKYGILTPYMVGKANKDLELDREETFLGRAVIELLKNEAIYENYSAQSLKRAEFYNKTHITEMWDSVILQ